LQYQESPVAVATHLDVKSEHTVVRRLTENSTFSGKTYGLSRADRAIQLLG
jgi:hypothetical protein